MGGSTEKLYRLNSLVTSQLEFKDHGRRAKQAFGASPMQKNRRGDKNPADYERRPGSSQRGGGLPKLQDNFPKSLTFYLVTPRPLLV